MPLPAKYPKSRKYKWMIIDDQWGLPDASTTCGPLIKAAFANDADKWNFGSMRFSDTVTRSPTKRVVGSTVGLPSRLSVRDLAKHTTLGLLKELLRSIGCSA